MKKANIPEGYQTVMVYLILHNASAFIQFMQNVFDADLTHKTMRDEHTIMHGELRIGDTTIMFADSTEKFQPCTAGFFIYVENADETYAKAIDAGANPVMEVQDQSYGRSGGIEDPFGNTWWLTSL